MKRQPGNAHVRLTRGALACALALAALSGAQPAGAVDFQNADGSLTGSFDTTLSLGAAMRTRSADSRLIATADGGASPGPGTGGAGRSPNIDDGNLNYQAGDVFSKALKLTTELSLKYGNYGLFARGAALHDAAVMDQNTRRTPIPDFAKSQAGEYARLLDAFVFGRWQLGEHHPFELRLGKQIVNWGESTFIQGGLTAVNPIDVSALHVPGAELKEAFLPQGMAKASLGLTEHVTAEAFALANWKSTLADPVGTYFSDNDFAVHGGIRVILGFGGFSDHGVDFRPPGGPLIPDFQNVPRTNDQEPKKSGQYGLALRWFLPDLGSGTEFGLYFLNYASRLPLISGTAGTSVGIANAAASAVAVGAGAQIMGALLAASVPPAAALHQVGALAPGIALGNPLATGATIQAGTLAQYATIGANMHLGRSTAGAIGAQANNIAEHEFAKTAGYHVEYPEDLKTIAVSFNTQLGTSGISLQGELAYRKDTPLQYDTTELLFAALTPLEQGLFPLASGGAPFPAMSLPCSGATATLSYCGQLGAFAPGARVQGWGLYDVWQFQATATKVFPPMLGAQLVALLAEVGVTDVPSLPSKQSGGPNGRGLRFFAPGASVSGNAALAAVQCPDLPAATCIADNLVDPQSAFPDRVSWGFVLRTRLDYPGLIGSWNVSPSLTFRRDVSGVSPGPGGNFIEGRYAVSVAVDANLQNRWQLGIGYSKFGGAGRFNLLGDRDFVAASLKVSF